MNLLKHILFLLLLLINFLDYFAEYFLNTLGSLILFTHTVVQEFIGLNTFPDILLGHISFIFYTISNSFTKNGRSRSRDFSSNWRRIRRENSFIIKTFLSHLKFYYSPSPDNITHRIKGIRHYSKGITKHNILKSSNSELGYIYRNPNSLWHTYYSKKHYQEIDINVLKKELYSFIFSYKKQFKNKYFAIMFKIKFDNGDIRSASTVQIGSTKKHDLDMLYWN